MTASCFAARQRWTTTPRAIASTYAAADGSAKMLVDLRAAVRAQLTRFGLANDAISREFLLAMEPYLFPDYDYGVIT